MFKVQLLNFIVDFFELIRFSQYLLLVKTSLNMLVAKYERPYTSLTILLIRFNLICLIKNE